MFRLLRKLRKPRGDEISPLIINESDGDQKIPYVDILQPSGVESDREEIQTSTSSLLSKNSHGSRRRRLISGSSETSDDLPEYDHGTSNLQTMMHLFKGNVGTGILSLPLAIHHAGVVVGPVCLLFIALLAIHCMHLIVECSHALCQRLNRDAMSYSDVAEECTRPYINGKSYYTRMVVNSFLLITQFGFCSVYFIFVATNINELLPYEVDKRIIIALLGIPVIILSFIRSLEKLSYLSTIANICCVSGLVAVYQYLFRNLNDPIHLPKFGGWSTFPLFISAAMFSFEGIGVVLPLENDMRNPEDFGWVINVGMGVVTLLFVSMGVLGYVAFGSDVDNAIILNLPKTPVYDVVKMSFAVAMFFTYFLQFYVPMQITLPTVLKRVAPRWKRTVEYLYRTAMVLMTCGLAASIPQLGNFIDLIGAFSSSALAIIFPPLFHIFTFHKNGIGVFGYAKNIFIITIGFIGFLFGTYSSIVAIIQGFQTHTFTYKNSTAIGNKTALPSLVKLLKLHNN